MIEHLARNWGNWASVAGLVFSILAFVFSKRASKAAEAARDSILGRTLGQEMMEAKHMAAEIARFMTDESSEMAKLRIDDLLSRVSYCVRRWDMRLSEQSKANLARCRDQLSGVQKVLSKKSISELSPLQKQQLAQAWGHVVIIFSEEYGAAMKATDSEV
jgi:hypothetical protein